MKILIDEEVVKQAVDVLKDRAFTDTDCESITALRTALDAEKVEPVAWIVPEFGFLFPTKDAATSYLRNIESCDTPTPLYTHPAPTVPEKVEPDYDWDQLEACRDSLREHMQLIAEMNHVGAWKLIRDTFEARMKSNGYGATALTRLDGGDYMSPSVHRHWEDELKKYAAPTPPTNTDESLVQLAKRLAEVIEERDELREAARAVVEWNDAYEWNDLHERIDRLRKALG